MFLKFGQEEHIMDLYKNGTIYINPIQYFRILEDNELRGDKYEGISKITNIPGGVIENKELNIKANFVHLELRESYKEVVGNIYSLYCISSFGFPNPLDYKFDERNLRFGSHCLMIKDNKAFLNLIEKKLKSLNLRFRHDFVEYYDRQTYNGKVTLFQKPKEFQYQQEFRFYVENKTIEPIVFQIGSLKGIAKVFQSDAITTLELRSKKKIA